MENIIKHIDIELYSPSPFEVIRAQQGDNKTRIIEFSLYDQGNPYTIPNNVTFTLEGHRGNNTSFIKDNYCSVRDNKIIVTLDKDILYAHGIVEATIVMYDITNNNILSTIPFRINVQKNPCDKNKIENDKKSLIDDIILSIEKIRQNFTEHITNFLNPHKVTKAQVGLGNVPNVTTNDQTPTYTESGTLAKLVSGEKLSVAFSKISKALTDLISHIADNTRHITSTERTNWNDAYNKRHTHSNKTVLDNTTASFTTEEKNKLNGIQSGAEVNVQSDWNVSDTDSDAFIKNKPSVYTKNEVDNKFSTLESNIDWKESVETYTDIEKTYPNPQDGWTVNVKDTDYTYRYSGTNWVTISANAIPKATNSVDGLLTKEDHANYDDANSKKHTHSNKTILDKITQTLLDNWNAAYSHIGDTVKHITSAERTNWNTVNNKVDKTGGTVTGSLKLDKGYYVHTANGNVGTPGWVKIATIKITGTYQNFPIMIELARRSDAANGEHTKLYIQFDNVNSTNPELINFIYIGADVQAHMHQTAVGVWDLYIQKAEAYDVIVVTDYSSGNGIVGSTEVSPSIEWKDVKAVSSPPAGTVLAELGGIVSRANKAIADDNGNNISNTYLKKSGGEVAGGIYPAEKTYLNLGYGGRWFSGIYTQRVFTDAAYFYKYNADHSNSYGYSASIAYNSGTELMYSSGSKTENSEVGLDISSSVGNIRLKSGGYIYLTGANGCISASTFTYSDEKVKIFTDDLDVDVDKLIQLFDIIRLKSYRYKHSNSNGLSLGFSAQDIEEACTQIGLEPEKYNILDIHYNFMLDRGDEEDCKYYTKFCTVSYNSLYNLSLLRMKQMEIDHQQQLADINERLSVVESMLNGGVK